jgi:hypothetical protein
MDWQSKHFTQQAVFSAARESVLEAGRAVVAEAFGPAADTADGFTAQGRSGWHAATAKVRLEPAPEGTRLVAELLVARAGWRSFTLVDAALIRPYRKIAGRYRRRNTSSNAPMSHSPPCGRVMPR